MAATPWDKTKKLIENRTDFAIKPEELKRVRMECRRQGRRAVFQRTIGAPVYVVSFPSQ